MIGVIVPVHNEQALLGSCLASIAQAALHSDLSGEMVQVVVVLDACNDDSAAIANNYGVQAVTVCAQNVGIARALGADQAIEQKARWLAFTDADTTVAPSWLAAQTALEADAVCGTVGVGDWWQHCQAVRSRYERDYHDNDDHRHVHGANFGVSAAAYRRAGGFPALRSGEDVALVDALLRTGARVAWSAAPRVLTSARTEARAVCGFGAFIREIVDAMDAATPSAEPCDPSALLALN